MDDRYFEYSIVVALRHNEIKSPPERIKGNHHLFSCDSICCGIDFPAGIKEWKRFETNNKTIALNIVQVPHDEIKITHTYKSEYNHTRKNQIVLLMITDDEKWHYTDLKGEPTEDGFNRPTKSLSRLFRGITANHNGYFYYLNCLYSFRTENALKKHERLCENNDYCSVEMPTKLNKILKYNHGKKSLKAPFVIYADLKCLLLKQQLCQNNPNESYTERKAIHEPCGYSLDLVCSFDSKEDKHSFYRGNDCIKKFCSELKELGTKVVNYEQKEMLLTSDDVALYQSQKQCHICGKAFCYDKKQEKRFKLYKKVRDHCHFTGKLRGAAHCICNLRYKVPQEISVKIHNGLKYDYHLIINELAEEFRSEDFECLGENTEKYISFSVPIKKERNNDSNETITYKIKFIDSCRFMPSKLSNLVDNLSEINNKDCKTCIERKNIKSECEFTGLKNNRLNYICKEYNETLISQ